MDVDINARGEATPLCPWFNECGEGEGGRKSVCTRVELEEEEG